MRRTSLTTQRSEPTRRRDPLGAWLAGVSRAALVGAALCWVAPAARAVDLVYDLPQDIGAIASDHPTLDSVLVDKREGAPLEGNEPHALEPISQISEFEPELAEPMEENYPPTAATPAQGAATQWATDDRIAARAAEPAPAIQEAKPRDGAKKPAASKFHGVTPGLTSRADLLSAWGQPLRVAVAKGETDGGEVLTYELPPFEQVEALVEQDLVAVVRVTLDEPTTVSQMVERLQLAAIDPVDLVDPTTAELLAVAFPEKGLTMLTRPSARSKSDVVTHLVLESIDARTFVLRSEQRDPHEMKAKLADLQLALGAEPQNAQAHWRMARQHLAAGQAAAAQNAAAKAVEIAPTDPAYRLTLAEALLATAEYDRAVLETRQVLDDEASPEIVRAGALGLMGRLAAMGDKTIASKTIDFHNSAIVVADQLATSEDDYERRLAKDLLVSSHLAVAQEIARGDYKDKATTVAEWVGRASAFAEGRIESDGGGLELRLQVAREALAALAGMRPTKDPGPWLNEAKETADALLAECDDPLMRARVHWDLGEAYQHAVRIEHLRGDANQALAYGSLAINELSEGAAPRTTSPSAEQIVGQLYFYLGAVNAVHKQDHAEAVGWYDKGREILTAERTPSEFVVPRRDGEELVSMGVSYWTQDQRDLAIELTESGSRLMERAVSAGVLDSEDLAVPYGNLATMYKKLDNGAKALEYGRLVRGVKGVDSTPVEQEKKATTQQQAANRPKPKPAAEPAAKVSTRMKNVAGRPLPKRWMNR
ncbi:hypothetical protein Pla108_16360 [Botrimarina colliarenosi]|uniref:Uncharacterized protein n=1 Tax=Botrimarina colliarenosi TaxID=2528001 RepID=A0A5C6ARC3_9BACT|nr:hypothetical protein [Botrimarina colliarenosi]TWU00684.1 hypothetical protein Pla108_16360 [Botrimarina colliarenosi]